MPILRTGRLWQRLDTSGAEHVLLDSGWAAPGPQRPEQARPAEDTDPGGRPVPLDRYARGTVVAADPVPYTCSYELLVDADWVSTRLVATTEGAGWLRRVTLERVADRWHVTAGEQGDLPAVLAAAHRPGVDLPGIENPHELAPALDIDLGGSPLTNTLPIRRLGLCSARTGQPHAIVAAWVLVPSLTVLPAQQEYTPMGNGHVRYASGTFQADLEVDADGFVTHYPGLARLALPAAG